MRNFLKSIFNKFESNNKESLKKQIQDEIVLDDESVTTTDVKESKQITTNNIIHVQTSLSLNGFWEKQLDQEQGYVLSYLHSSLPKINKGRIAITGFDVEENPNFLIATCFIRNGLSSPIRFKSLPVTLYDENNEAVAKQVFDLAELGEIPAFSDRPWSFIFDKKNVVKRKLKMKKWRAFFQIKKAKNILSLNVDIDPKWESELDSHEIESLSHSIKSIASIHEGEFGVTGINARYTDDDEINALILFKNGGKRTIVLNEINLLIEDATGEEVASGIFKTDLKIKPYSCKPWNFLFENNNIIKKDADLSKWKIRTFKHGH